MTVPTVVSALQIGSRLPGKAESLAAILDYEKEITASGSKLVVMPEALLGGYPKGEIFGTRLGYRLPEGREVFAAYFENAIDVPGSETNALAALSQRTGAHIIIGVIERSGSTLYCTALFFSPTDGLVAKHRKLMPTGTERLIWGQGDGSTLPVVETDFGRIGSAICWENHMPQLRLAMYGQGIDIWAAPTVDDRDIWQCSMRHIAHEGRCFLVSACQFLDRADHVGLSAPGYNSEQPLIRGGSVIAGPYGEVLSGPIYGKEALISAEIDLSEITRARYDFDVVGHYARPDVFSLRVNRQANKAVVFASAAIDEEIP